MTTLPAISFFNSFPIAGSKDIGLFESQLCLSPPLNNGITCTILYASGKTPCWIQQLNNLARKGEIT